MQHILPVRVTSSCLIRRAEYIGCIHNHAPRGRDIQLHIAEYKVHIHFGRTVPQPGLRKIDACAAEYIIHIHKADHSAEIFNGIPEYIVIGNRIFHTLYIGYPLPPVSNA